MHIDTLVPYTSYSWSVAAVTVAAGPASERLQFTTLVDGRLLDPHCRLTHCNEDYRHSDQEGGGGEREGGRGEGRRGVTDAVIKS